AWVELRAQERLDRLRVRDVVACKGGEALELLPAALARCAGDLGVDVVGEELERMLLAVLLAHEEERRVRREERHRGGDAQRCRRQAIAERAVSDLVVVLR